MDRAQVNRDARRSGGAAFVTAAFLAIATVAVIFLLLSLFRGTPAAHASPWLRAYVTGYSTREHLTGCYAPARCRMACGGLLDDRRYTVAANPRLGLRCGQRIVVCGNGCHVALVADRTASRFDFEFTYALAVATGAPRGYPGFATPRVIVWRVGA